MREPSGAVLSLLLIVAASVAATASAVSATAPPEPPEIVRELPQPERLWNRIDHVLADRVRDGLVRYEGLRDDGPFQEAWRCFISVTWEELDSWPKDDQLAFWINAYNLCTMKLIADHYPIRPRFPLSLIVPDNSILMIPGRWKKIRFPIAGAERTLDEIEHAILRARFDEPRIHFTIVGGALGSPRLRGEAYRGSRIDYQLEEQARRFFGRRNGLQVDVGGSRPTVRLTKILDWFGEDFEDLEPDPEVLETQEGDRGRLLAVTARWFPPDVRELVRRAPVRIKWIAYDWELNEWKPAGRSKETAR